MANTKLPARLLDTSAAPALNVTGTVTAGGLDIGPDSLSGDLVSFGSNSSSQDVLSLYSNTVTSGTTLKVYQDHNGSTGEAVYIQNDGTGNALRIREDAVDVFVVKSGGNIGVGTASPQDTLHVITDSSTTNDTVDVARIEATSSGTPAVGFGPTIDFRGERGSASSDSMGRIGYVADVMTASRVDGAFVVETAVDGTYSEHLRVTSTGRVGVGQLNPAAKLQVTGGNDDTNGQFRISTTASGDDPQMTFLSNSNGRGIYLDDSDTNKLKIYSGYGKGVTAKEVVFDNEGRVGIGEQNPLGKLHVKEDDSGVSAVNANFDQLVLEDDLHAGMSILSGTSGDGAIYFGDSGTNDIGQIKYRHASDRLDFTTLGDIRMIIHSDGDITMGTTSKGSQSKLNVNGGVSFAVSSVSHGLNVVSTQAFNNSNVANACGSLYYKCFIINIYHNNGSSQVFGIANGGGGVGYNFTLMRPDSSAQVHGQGVSFSLTTIGSSPMTFTIALSSGGGALTVNRTSGSGTYYVSVHQLAGA